MLQRRIIKYTRALLLSVPCVLSDNQYELPGLFGKVLYTKVVYTTFKNRCMYRLHIVILYMLYMLVSRTYIDVTRHRVFPGSILRYFHMKFPKQEGYLPLSKFYILQ